MIRCKFICLSIEPNQPSYPDHNAGSKVTMDARWEPKIPEDERFQKWTPSGSLVFHIDNPKAVEEFKVGSHYYVDLTLAV